MRTTSTSMPLVVAARLPSIGQCDAVRRWAGPVRFDHVETLWEPTVLLAARLREAFGAPGLSYDEALCFRDKDRMKQAVSAAGLRTARHRRASGASECVEAAERVGFRSVSSRLPARAPRTRSASTRWKSSRRR